MTSQKIEEINQKLQTSEEFHVTRVTERGVYGHSTDSCDEAGCAAGSDVYWAEVDADEVEAGHVYAIAGDGEVLAEVEV